MRSAERLRRSAAAAAALAILAGASLACAHASPPPVSAPDAYKEMGPWTPASPADAAPRGDWWTVFGDPTLSALEQRIDQGNPDLNAALARYDESRALLAEARAAQLPRIDGAASATYTGQSQHRPLRVGGPDTYDNDVLGATASYELDLWGRVRKTVAANKKEVQASAADLASVRLSLEAELADAYLGLRGLDVQAKLLADTTAAYAKALKLTQDQHDGGAVAGLDVDRAETQLRTAKAQQVDVAAQRALYEHAIASLVGEPASTFSIAALAQMPTPPKVPVSAPSTLLLRRPDVAAAERRTEAANLRIGAAKTAYFPTISLDASAGLQTAGGVNLLQAGNGFWAVGPALAQTLFDGGRRKAAVRQARDQFDEAAASYRATVLAAFQEVEDNLALCNRLADEAREQAAAVEAAKKGEDVAMTQYELGAVTYLDVVVAQTADLEAQRTDIAIATRRLQASVDLIRALGGGWDPHQPALTAKTAGDAVHAP
jgi:NodT family efflux transporter outer membrane factor (OMF) lipoprotein